MRTWLSGYALQAGALHIIRYVLPEVLQPQEELEQKTEEQANGNSNKNKKEANQKSSRGKRKSTPDGN